MLDILSRSNLEVLEAFAWSNVLLAFDFDGTLAPIVSDPEKAAMRPRTRALLQDVAAAYPVVVLSGRSRLDVVRRLRGVPAENVLGNHGIESWAAGDRFVAQVKGWRPALDAVAASLKGVVVEDKGIGLAVHYRQSREKKKARAAILKTAATLPDARVISGKQVVNVVPGDAPHKGIALERERERLGCDTAIYVGDDKTDEDVFELEQPGRLLTIRVGEKRSSAATYFVADQRCVDGFLRALVEIRRRSSQSRRAVR